MRVGRQFEVFLVLFRHARGLCLVVLLLRSPGIYAWEFVQRASVFLDWRLAGAVGGREAPIGGGG